MAFRTWRLEVQPSQLKIQLEEDTCHKSLVEMRLCGYFLMAAKDVNATDSEGFQLVIKLLLLNEDRVYCVLSV